MGLQKKKIYVNDFFINIQNRIWYELNTYIEYYVNPVYILQKINFIRYLAI